VYTSKCHVCQKEKVKNSLDELYLYVEKGTPDGHEESFKDAADEYVDQRAGEVNMKVVQLPHARFTRENENLKTSMKISLLQALTGFTKEI
jgi:DnaJ-class molecular chaperone